MDTLYELLGALPKDDAEGLRVAFRKAVKGAHPDLRPDDPDAGMKFRQIVRANEILLDKDQRQVYDHLLVLAQHEKDPASAHPIAARIHRIASTVLALASLSIVTAGGYFLFMHMSMALVAPAGSVVASHTPSGAVDLTTRLTASIAAVSPTDTPDPAAVNAFIAARVEGTRTEGAKTEGIKAEGTRAEGVTAAASSAVNAMAMATADAESTPPAASTPPDQGGDYASAPHARDVPVLTIGDIGGVPTDADRVVQLDQTLTAPYVDRGILFFRERMDDRPFPDLAPLKRPEKPNHAKSVVATGKPHADAMPRDAMPRVVPMPMPRTAPRYAVPQPSWYATATN